MRLVWLGLVDDLRPVRRGPVNVVVPYVPGMLRPEVVAALGDASPTTVDVSGADDAYWRLLLRLWSGGPFMLVEQDVVVAPTTVEDMASCEAAWCAAPYLYGSMPLTAFGCMAFGTILGRHPDVVAAIPPEHRGWQSLDAMVIGELHRRGEREHVHGPRVLHLRDPEPEARRLALGTAVRLRYIGDGRRYLDGIPARDVELTDPVRVAIAIESGLYAEVRPRSRRAQPGRPAEARADAAAADAPEGGY